MNRILNGSLLIGLALTLGACGNPSGSHAHDEHAHETHADHAHDEPSRGPHGGRLLSKDTFTLELSIFETGVEPHFRAYATVGGKPIPPDQVDLNVNYSASMACQAVELTSTRSLPRAIIYAASRSLRSLIRTVR